MAINTLSSLPILGPLRQSAGNRPGQLPRPIPPVGRRQWQRGYTLVEIALTLIIIGVLASLADASYEASLYRAKVATAASDITMIAMAASRFQLERNRYPTDLAEVGKATMLDPWGHAYGYVDHASSPPGKWRKDKNIHPINSDFDLYSNGKDGTSVPALTAKPSRDDIVRANDGAFVGLASDYDP